MGRGPLRLSGARTLCLSHGHLDHALGLPLLLSHRSLQTDRERTRVICPAAVADEVRAFVDSASRLERRDYRFDLVPLRGGDRVELEGGFELEAFETPHTVPSLGYHLIRHRTRLAEHLTGRSHQEIARLRSEGEPVDERVSELLVSYCGDTSGEILEREPRLLESRVLIIEVTYLAPEHRRRAAEYGHLHLEDLVRVQEAMSNEAVLLVHLSRRHRLEELRRAVDERMPRIADRVVVWGQREDSP